MQDYYEKNLSHFFCVGVNYKKADTAVRGLFALSTDQYDALLQSAAGAGFSELFVLSTCNRTEVYGFAPTSVHLAQLLCGHTAGTAEVLSASGYSLCGSHAVRHLFHVGAGLDSQILGDYEIVGQLKTAVKFAKAKGFVGAFTERLINCVLQASKLVKQQTAISGGTVSVAFAAVQYMKAALSSVQDKSVLILGTGKIGRNTCRNLIDYLGIKNITLINRSPQKAIVLANELGLRAALFEQLHEEVAGADVVIVATGAEQPVINQSHVADGRRRLVLDLSVPCNVAPNVAEFGNLKLVNVDTLSQLKDETLRQRRAEVPKAQAIIDGVMGEFNDWQLMRRHAPLLRSLKNNLRQLHEMAGACPFLAAQGKEAAATHIQRVLNDTAGKIRTDVPPGCQYITALHQFVSAKN